MDTLNSIALNLPSAFTDAEGWIPSRDAIGVYADIFDSIDDTGAVYMGKQVTSQEELGRIISERDQTCGNVLLHTAIEDNSLQLIGMSTRPDQYIDRVPMLYMVRLNRVHLVDWVIRNRKIREGTLKAAFRAAVDFNKREIFERLANEVIPTAEDFIQAVAQDRLDMAEWLISRWTLFEPGRLTAEQTQRLLQELLQHCKRPDEAIALLLQYDFNLGDTSIAFDAIFTNKVPSPHLLDAAHLLLAEATRLPAQVHLDKLLYYARDETEADQLIEHGANIKTRHFHRETVLHNASRQGRIGVIRSVLSSIMRVVEANRDPNPTELRRFLSLRSSKGLEGLHLARDMTTVIALLDWGAPIDVTGGSDGDRLSPLGMAIREKRDSAAIALLIRNANPNFPSDENMLEAALGNRMFGVVRLLLVHGANPENLRRNIYFYAFHLESSSLLHMISEQLLEIYPSMSPGEQARLRHYAHVKWPEMQLDSIFPPPMAYQIANLDLPDWDDDFPVADDRIVIPDYFGLREYLDGSGYEGDVEMDATASG